MGNAVGAGDEEDGIEEGGTEGKPYGFANGVPSCDGDVLEEYW
jgi:hypothetical protein